LHKETAPAPGALRPLEGLSLGERHLVNTAALKSFPSSDSHSLPLLTGGMFYRRFGIHRDVANLTTLVVDDSNAAFRIVFGFIE
jgi:hypothetical protein